MIDAAREADFGNEVAKNTSAPEVPYKPPKINRGKGSALITDTPANVETPVGKEVVRPKPLSGSRRTSGSTGGQATIGGLMTMAGLSMTVIALIQTKVAFDEAYKEAERQNSQKPLEDEAIRQAVSWGLGIGAGIAFSFALKGAMGGAALGPTGMAIGFFGGIAFGAFASSLGGKTAEAGIESGAVDPLRVLFKPEGLLLRPLHFRE